MDYIKYINDSLKTLAVKNQKIKYLINDPLFISDCFDVPLLDMTLRRLDRILIDFLAVTGVKNSGDFNISKGLNVAENYFSKTKKIKEYVNEFFQENIRLDYDDIRRKNLKLFVL